MKRFGLVLTLLLSLAASSVLFLAKSTTETEQEPLLLFTQREDSVNKLYILNAATGERRFVSDILGEWSEAGWLPDGGVWIADSLGENRQLRFFNLTTGEVTVFEDLLLDGCFDNLAWSPDSSQLAYLKYEADELFVKFHNLDDGSTFEIPTVYTELNMMPDWSSDGNYISISPKHPQAPARIYRASDGREILFAPHFYGFSPDNRYIAYTDETSKPYLYELATGETIEFDGNYDEVQWSPNGRYLIAIHNDPANQLSYYDTENGDFHTIDFGYPVRFAAWMSDESQILAYADFALYNIPATLLSYRLATGEIETLLTGMSNTDGRGRVFRNGDWLIIPYSPKLPKFIDPYVANTNLLFLNGEERLDFDILVGNSWYSSRDILSLENGGGFIITSDNLYYFNSQNTQLEVLDSGYIVSHVVPSPDARYLADLRFYQSSLTLWNLETGTSSLIIETRDDIRLVGWRGSSRRFGHGSCPEG